MPECEHPIASIYPHSLSCISISGKDARSFLQGLITNDLSLLEKQGAMRSLAVDVKGKILADFYIRKDRDDTLLLYVGQEQAQILLQHLDFYLIREEARLTLHDDPVLYWECLGSEEQWRQLDAHNALRTAAHEWRRIAFDPPALGSLQQLSAEQYEALRPFFGIATLEVDFPKRIPQEANLGELVSFTKGCFLGQEVVSRMEHKGRATRLLTRFAARMPLEVGADISSNGRKVGNITSATPMPIDGQHYALGLCKTNQLSSPLQVADIPLEHSPLVPIPDL